MEEFSAFLNKNIGVGDPVFRKWAKSAFFFIDKRENDVLFRAVLNLGILDIFIRALENEAAKLCMPEHCFTNAFLDLQSDLWIRSAYSILYALPKDSRLKCANLFDDFDFVRTAIEKFEIPKDRNFNGPITLNNFEQPLTDVRFYDPSNPKKGFSAPVEYSSRGSKMWFIPSYKLSENVWYERQQLSENFLDTFSC